MRKALFLDRDGVINRERGQHTWKLTDFEILPDVFPALKMAQEKGYLLIVISNQSGIAKGLYTKEDVEKLHGQLRLELRAKGIELTEIYYCPHYDDKGKCLCRKPGSLLFEKAIARFGIAPENSLMIGDKERDTEAAEKLGVRGVQIEANSGILSIIENL